MPPSQVQLRKCSPNTNYNIIWSWVLGLHIYLAPLYLSNSTSVCCFFYGAFTATGKLCYFAQTNEICYVQKFSTRLRIEGKVLLQHTFWMKTLSIYLLTQKIILFSYPTFWMHVWKKTFRSKAITIITFACHNLSYTCVLVLMCTAIA